ncbi:MAG TPA: tripartite tricarboxylate transporter TctB family protein [Hyphomicrobiaceae bacterium]|nr:tripartite tricarboxylate transporter TctB family protein [Hyphomicrobiaceae bacterium]
MRLGPDGIAGLVGLAISLVLLPLSFGLPKLPIVPIGPGFYPAIVLAFLAVTSAALVIQDVVAQRRSAVAGEPAAGPRRAYGLVAAAFAVVTAYIVLLPQLGFRISTALFVATFQFVLERPATLSKWLILIAIAVATSLITYLVFDTYLSVLLPRGRWTDW